MVEEWIILDWGLASTAASFFVTFWAMPKSWERRGAKTNLRPKPCSLPIKNCGWVQR
jgi:hypothetical protein